MSKYITILILSLILLSCVNNGNSNIGDNNTIVPDYSNPDPINNDEVIKAVPADLAIALNINGEIRYFQADTPSSYTRLVDDVCTDTYFKEIKLAFDKQYLLYVNSEKSLVLFDVAEKNIKAVLVESVSCNEAQFIDNNRIQFSNGGNIYCYTISTELTYKMIDNPVYFCNNGAVVSPDGTKIVFKNQDPSQTEFAVYSWADVTGETVTDCTYLGDYTGDINLLELFEFIWVDNEILFIKPNSDINSRIKAYSDVENPFPVSSNVVADGSVIQFSELSISDDRTKLCVYGSFGLYQVDIPSIDFESSISVDEIYKSEVVTTRYAAYSAGSDYLVAATSGCINIYEADTLYQTDFDSTKIISDGDTIYSIDCK